MKNLYKKQAQAKIEELKINIKNIQTTINQRCWDKGYVNNMKKVIISYQNSIKMLKIKVL
jgi:hypothetical protein